MFWPMPSPLSTLVVSPKVQMDTFTPSGLRRAAARSRNAAMAAAAVWAVWSARL